MANRGATEPAPGRCRRFGDLAPISAVFASKQIFDAAGMAIPSEQARANFTWDTIVELARTLAKPDGSQYGLHVEYFESVLYSGGAYYVNDRVKPTKGAMDDPRWSKAIDLWVDWTTKEIPAPATLKEVNERLTRQLQVG